MIAQLILGGVILIALGGAFLSWKADIRAEGEARVIEQMREQQAARDRQNLRLAQDGEQEAKRLLGEALKRSRKQAAELSALRSQWKGESDARAKEDIEWSLYREQHVPRFGADKLRSATVLAPDEQGSNLVPGGNPLSAAPLVPADTGPSQQRWTDRVRALFNRATQTGMESGGSGPK